MVLVHSLAHSFKNTSYGIKYLNPLVEGLLAVFRPSPGSLPPLPFPSLLCPPRNLVPRLLSVQGRLSGSGTEPRGFGKQQEAAREDTAGVLLGFGQQQGAA